MEYVSNRIVSRMISADLISEEEAKAYSYGIQFLLEKIISYVIIFVLAIVINRLIEILIFIVSFSLLRKYSGGIHCSRFGTCLVASTLVSLSGPVIFMLADRFYPIYQGGGIMSIIIVIIIGSINNPNIDWSAYEYKRAKIRARLIISLEVSVLSLLLVLHIPNNIRFYISYGIVVCAISMLLEIRKKGGVAYEEGGETAS